jgi:hypothetical protein
VQGQRCQTYDYPLASPAAWRSPSISGRGQRGALSRSHRGEMQRVELLLILLLLQLLVYLFPCTFWGGHYCPVQIGIEVCCAVIAECTVHNAAVIDIVIMVRTPHLGCTIRSHDANLLEVGNVDVVDHEHL